MAGVGAATVLALWIMLGLQLMSYALAYSVTPWDLDRADAHDHGSVAVAYGSGGHFLAGWHWAELEKNRHPVGNIHSGAL
jgi:hypothetical protein